MNYKVQNEDLRPNPLNTLNYSKVKFRGTTVDFNCGSKGLSYNQLEVQRKALNNARARRKQDNYKKIYRENISLYDKLTKI